MLDDENIREPFWRGERVRPSYGNDSDMGWHYNWHAVIRAAPVWQWIHWCWRVSVIGETRVWFRPPKSSSLTKRRPHTVTWQQRYTYWVAHYRKSGHWRWNADGGLSSSLQSPNLQSRHWFILYIMRKLKTKAKQVILPCLDCFFLNIFSTLSAYRC